MRRRHWILGAALVAVVAVVVVAVAAGGRRDDVVAPDAEAATLTPVKGSDVTRVGLSADAMRRLGIRTAPVVAAPNGRTTIPYAAVLYDASGRTFTYTSPAPRQFVRRPIGVVRIAGPRAILSSGPHAGTAVVTVGAQELYGAEYEVEED